MIRILSKTIELYRKIRFHIKAVIWIFQVNHLVRKIDRLNYKIDVTGKIVPKDSGPDGPCL
jgi:hypothetical protein